ncbi:hypothetical protein CKAN_01906300 [Cinnamomum micranthum f. kanehirae]|uniref:Uncharacterized protein n=1 Tax=Cinnamomum micranthum f. kanehirae TaxID=337451 RepID=A0A3S3MUG8_9MAGN|nr:hypothetical protein CKAN_01906300 [Cinnamomum micranthum f. kanehirae]
MDLKAQACDNKTATKPPKLDPGGEVMEIERMKQLLLLWSRSLTTRVALVGGNHTSSRFCTR